jgi:hypothetical protein
MEISGRRVFWCAWALVTAAAVVVAWNVMTALRF